MYSVFKSSMERMPLGYRYDYCDVDPWLHGRSRGTTTTNTTTHNRTRHVVKATMARSEDENDDNHETFAAEMQPINPNIKHASMSVSPIAGVAVRSASSFSSMRYRATQLLVLLKLYMDSYPRMTSLIVAGITVATFLSLVLSFRQPVKRNKLYHDYSKIDMTYTFKASQIDHWCLYGGDDSCSCDDFTEPLSRFEKKDWIETHEQNVELIQRTKQYDVVFYGDEVTEGWNGRWLGRSMIPPTDAAQISQLFNETFTKAGGGEFEGIALGVMGDVAPNLLWRLRHDEMPTFLKSKVYWLQSGINELIRGGCSEEVTLLGILRVADEIYFSNPKSVIVIQGILPYSKPDDGSLHHEHHGYAVNNDRQKEFNAKGAAKYNSIWPSIQTINSELEKFCKLHDHLVYFDVSALFLGSMGNEYYQQKEKHIIVDLLFHGKSLTYDGYTVLGTAIHDKLSKIINKGDETNDVET